MAEQNTDEQALVLERNFEAPREKVWKAWTVPEEFAKWFGAPGKVDPTTVSLDVREGGRWAATTTAEGREIPFTGSYREVSEPEHLALTFDNGEGSDRDDSDVEVVTITLADENGGTKMSFRQAGNLPPGEYDVDLRKGWTGFFDKLEGVLKV